MLKYQIQTFFISIVIISLMPVSLCAKSSVSLSKIKAYVDNGTVILNDESGKSLIAINPTKQYVPASIIKILTATISLNLLGENFRFKTECYSNSQSDIIIKGYGDPFFVSDEIRSLAQNLKQKGITKINKLLFDHSFFEEDVSIPGLSTTNNPYDALNGALVVNFNTIYVEKNASGVISSAEDETPLTPLAKTMAASLPVNSKERINLSSKRSACNQYAAELIYTIFREQGISITDTVTKNTAVDSSHTLIYTHYNSRTLSEVLQGLLQYSNNFIANQLFLYTGAHKKGAPASMQKGREVFEHYINNVLNIPKDKLAMVEGSGISRANHVNGTIMAAIMEQFKPNVELLTPKNGHPVKSGTLHHVSNYAGYIKTENGLRSFVIMLNQEKNYRDTLMKLLAVYP